MSIRPKTHARAEAKHSQRRAQERYDVSLSKDDICQIGKIIMSPNRDNKVFLHQQDDGCSHWLVRYKGDRYRLVFDERTRTTRTFMEMRPIDEKVWRDTHDNAGHPTLGDTARISKLKLR
jgi:hypothetical protein